MTYWRMAMRMGNNGPSMWPRCKSAGVAAITYYPVAELDLTPFTAQNLPNEWSELENPRKANLRRVAFDMEAGDTILVKEGALIVGRGRIIGQTGRRAYQYKPELGLVDNNGTPWPHTVPVEWENGFEPVAVTLGHIQISTVEKIEASDAAKVDDASRRLSSHSVRKRIQPEYLPQLDIMIPDYRAGHHPFNIGDQPDYYSPESIKEDKEAVTARTDFFIKYLVGISWAIDGPVPYAFKTRDGKIRSLDAGCLGSLSHRSPPDVSFLLNSERTIIAVEPSEARKTLYWPMRTRLLADLDANQEPMPALRPDNVAPPRKFLSVPQIRAILLSTGFVETETKKLLRFTDPRSKEFPFYLKRPELGSEHIVRPLVMHPNLPDTKPALLTSPGVVFGSKWYHHSNMREFPLRTHSGETDRQYGISMDFENEAACAHFLSLATSIINAAQLMAAFNVSDDDVVRDIEGAKADLDAAASVTERMALVKSRIGQGRFREDLIQFWGGCAVTTVVTSALLKASHIKPWRHGTNQERLDKYNGLLLTPNLDHAFDAGLITFNNHGTVVISPSVAAEEAAALGLNPGLRLKQIQPGHQPYLEWHRSREFIG